MIFVLLGAPGAGKGTLAKLMITKWHIPQISTGDLLRVNVADKTPLGMKANVYMEKGDLVPDELVMKMVRERFLKPDCKKGFILDGFPRTTAQAIALDALLAELKLLDGKLTAAINLSIPPDELKKRLLGRRTCSNTACQAIYNVYFPQQMPKKENICDKCNSALIQRSDETEEVISNRLKVYEEKTAPLIKFYKEKNLLRTYESDSTEKIFEKLAKDLKGK